MEAGRAFGLTPMGHSVRLASEAYRIRLVTYSSVFGRQRAQIEALPHQITAVDGEMLPVSRSGSWLGGRPGCWEKRHGPDSSHDLADRGNLERWLIVAPGNLLEQWQDELSGKIRPQILDALTRYQIEGSITGQSRRTSGRRWAGQIATPMVPGATMSNSRCKSCDAGWLPLLPLSSFIGTPVA